jgi:hypothetical protein
MKKMNAADRTTQLSPLRSLTGRCAPLSRGVAQSLDADVVSTRAALDQVRHQVNLLEQ